MVHNFIGKIVTVLGAIEPDRLGVTLSDDHPLNDLTIFRGPPQESSAREIYFADISPEILSFSRYYGFRNFHNIRVGDIDTAISEVSRFKEWGGNSIATGSNIGLGRDPIGLARISRATGVNIIMGGSFYAVRSHPADMDRMTEEGICERLVRDIVEGVDGTGVHSGFMGEVGCTSPTAANENKVLLASVCAQRNTGAPMMIHPGESDTAPLEHLELIARHGVNMGKVIMAHVSTRSRDSIRQIAESGCYLQFDGFGAGTVGKSAYNLTYRGTNEDPKRYVASSAPGDDAMLDQIEWLSSEGYGERLLLASDVNTKARLFRYGGHGYFYVLANIVPRMHARGWSEDTVKRLLVDNPRDAFTFAAPA